MRDGQRQREGHARGSASQGRARGRAIGRPRGREWLGEGIASLQRTRLLRSAVGLLAEQGYASASVAAICARAGVSRRTYYEIFENREECLAAILADAEARVQAAITQAGFSDARWRERVRGGLWAILSLADSDPALARVCLVESGRARGLVASERERILKQLVAVVDEGRPQGTRGGVAGALTAEALVGAVSAVLAARIGEQEGGGVGAGGLTTSLRGLLGELMGMIVLPYLGPGAARRELARPLPKTLLGEPAALPVEGVDPGTVADGSDPLAGLPMRLTYRTARVLLAVAQLGDPQAGASNRQVAERAGISDAGQASKLLWRLAEHGLLENAATGSRERGEANQWRLTHTGRRVVQSIGSEIESQGYRSAA